MPSRSLSSRVFARVFGRPSLQLRADKRGTSAAILTIERPHALSVYRIEATWLRWVGRVVARWRPAVAPGGAP
ncbi:MAG: hypothetical protein K8W52_28910 [Deltaproteobacteria bacterium]|nr:hypothetical protein [Deltaproteobacteria bacterium]